RECGERIAKSAVKNVFGDPVILFRIPRLPVFGLHGRTDIHFTYAIRKRSSPGFTDTCDHHFLERLQVLHKTYINSIAVADPDFLRNETYKTECQCASGCRHGDLVFAFSVS